MTAGPQIDQDDVGAARAGRCFGRPAASAPATRRAAADRDLPSASSAAAPAPSAGRRLKKR